MNQPFSREQLIPRLRALAATGFPLPGQGHTHERHACLMEIGREDLSLARLAEAHFDAVAILAEAGRKPEPGVLYGVWASEIPGHALALLPHPQGFQVNGSKMFSSGAGIVDRALVTVGEGQPQLVDIDLRDSFHSDLDNDFDPDFHNDLRHPQPGAASRNITYDFSIWKTRAFLETATASVTFSETPVTSADLIEAPGWYLDRPGFWHGACGPASCWAGGAQGLLDFALEQKRNDPHTLAHLGAMQASVWALKAYLDTAGREIDNTPLDARLAHTRALTLRHLVEQASTDILRRFSRAYGPAPLAMNQAVSLRCQELELYLRQSHAERDLEALGHSLDR